MQINQQYSPIDDSFIGPNPTGEITTYTSYNSGTTPSVVWNVVNKPDFTNIEFGLMQSKMIKMFTPTSVSNTITKNIFKLNLGLRDVTDQQATNIVSWIKVNTNWKYSTSNKDKVFTSMFSNNETDIAYFDKLSFEQDLNAQRPVPDNSGVVIFDNWPTDAEVVSVELKLTDQPRCIVLLMIILLGLIQQVK